jgi:hypothetical protein
MVARRGRTPVNRTDGADGSWESPGAFSSWGSLMAIGGSITREVTLPGFVKDRFLQAAAARGMPPEALLAAAAEAAWPPTVSAAAQSLLAEAHLQEDLAVERLRLEAEEAVLLRRAGRRAAPGKGMSMEEPMRLVVAVEEDRGDWPQLAVLAVVTGLSERAAILELAGWRAAIHYRNYELAYDNQVIGFHNAALRAAPARRSP